ncbi:putative protein modification by small protein conjugation [Lyophyllum shimeji]|uniref:UBC core domain-containing protein n=1 Tax=Lyophyllum shimeji TaxID=47721 RepID=A0A9P3PNQ2_LYOSH|nr:putative protein modification by small protein conjugation [Lyophyllum shimeji]
MPLPRTLLSRLHHDLQELLDSPYPGVDVFFDDANIQRLCLVLTPPSGPWKGLALHFDVELPNHWPSSPPMIYSSVAGIKHPNLNGNWICCDLLKEQDELERGYTGGYTPALTLRGLFLQFLTFFSSTKVEQSDGRTVEIGDYLLVRYELDAMSSDQLHQLWSSSPSPEVVVRGMNGHVADPRLPRETSNHRVKEVNVPLRRIETVNPRWHSTYHLISQWRCKRCPYGSEALPIYRTPGHKRDDEAASPRSFSPAPLPCHVGNLNDDVLLELSRHLPSESLVSFSTAYPRFRRLVTSSHVLLERELRCFFLRNPLRTSVLGIGIALEPDSRTLSSDFDWLSKEAFDTYNVRLSVQKREFQYFLPLAFNRHHFERVEQDIWAHLATLDAAVRDAQKRRGERNGEVSTRRTAPPEHPHQTVGVIFKLMNNIVVALMQACDDVIENTRPLDQSSPKTLLHASEKAVTAYGHLFHLLLCLSRTTPCILHEALDRLHRFIQVPTSRFKAEVPDLGELIILITLVLAYPPTGSNPVTWATINGPFLEEAIVRNVRWVLKAQPVLEAMETGPSDFRLQQTFIESKVSLRLIMFQRAFLDIFVNTYASNLGRLDDNYGFPEPDIPGRMVEEIKAIYKVDTWMGFFHRVQYARGLAFGKEAFSEMLRAAVRTSAQRKYHVAKRPREMHLLWRDREVLERKWARRRS